MQKLVLEQNKNLFLSQLEKEFQKNENDLIEYMKILRNWAKTQPHFPELPADNILKFVLIYNKFSIERAKQKLDMYYTIRTLMADVFTEHPLSKKMIEFSKVFYCIPLPKHTEDYKRIIYIQFNPNYDPEAFDHLSSLIHNMHVLELLIETDDCPSFHIIINGNGVKPGHVGKFNPMVLKKNVAIIEKVYSSRIASIHFANLQSFSEVVLNNIIKPALNKKLRDRLKISTTTDLLFSHFGKERLPRDLGGNQPSVAELNEMLLKQFEHCKDRFDKLQVLKVDESRRPQKLENDEVLGYYGNFKKINFD